MANFRGPYLSVPTDSAGALEENAALLAELTSHFHAVRKTTLRRWVAASGGDTGQQQKRLFGSRRATGPERIHVGRVSRARSRALERPLREGVERDDGVLGGRRLPPTWRNWRHGFGEIRTIAPDRQLLSI